MKKITLLFALVIAYAGISAQTIGVAYNDETDRSTYYSGSSSYDLREDLKDELGGGYNIKVVTASSYKCVAIVAGRDGYYDSWDCKYGYADMGDNYYDLVEKLMDRCYEDYSDCELKVSKCK